MMRSGNPVLKDSTFVDAAAIEAKGGTMTIQGTVNRTFILLLMLIASAVITWSSPKVFLPFLIPGAIVGFITAIVTVFKKEWSPVTAPIYAVLEGLVLGGISLIFELSYPGIVIQAVALTFLTLFSLLLAYRSGLIRPSENFKLGIFAATGAIALLYIGTMVLGFFHIQVPLIYGNGPIGIIFSLFVVAIAALNLVLDFDFIETGANAGVPKYMEWYGAFGLIVTLVWLYLEILRLLSKTRR